MKALLALVLLFFILPVEAEAAKRQENKEVVASDLSSGELYDYIKTERAVLRNRYKVDLVKKFKNESFVKVERFGNKKEVLNLNGVSFGGGDLRGVALTMASMVKTNLSHANLEHADLIGIDFSSADLSDANFSKADLSGAIFEAASLKGANFNGANLFGARFVKITDLSQAEVNSLKNRTNSYVDLEKEPLPDYYIFKNGEIIDRVDPD